MPVVMLVRFVLMTLLRSVFSALFALLVASIIIAVITALPTMIFAALAMVFSALVSFAAFPAAAAGPRDGMHFDDRPYRIIAVDHHFAWMRLSLRGFVSYDHLEAGAGAQRRGVRIVHQAPMPALMFERHLGNM
jgi:hypothetical protein